MPPRTQQPTISVRGAREHNLRNINVELPRDKLIVFTGLSGSGKSSLAFDTIYAEGQRRYVESLSSYARQFLGSDGQARRRRHRGPVAGDRDRPEVGRPQPPLDGRHDHRDLRLPAPAVRPHRHPALPRARQPARAPDAAADRRPRPGAARGHPLPGAGPGRPRPQGRVRHAARGPLRAGLRARPHRRRGRRDRRVPEARRAARPLRAAQDRDRRRPPGDARGHRPPAHRLAGDGAQARRRRRRARDRPPGGRSRRATTTC